MRKIEAVAGLQGVVLPNGWVLDGGDQVVVTDDQWTLIQDDENLEPLLNDLGATTDPVMHPPTHRDIQRAVYDLLHP